MIPPGPGERRLEWRGRYRQHKGSPGLLVDVRLAAGQRLSRVLPGHQHDALELGDQHTVLVEHPRVHPYRPPVGLGARRLDLEHFRLDEQGVTVEHRCRVVACPPVSSTSEAPRIPPLPTEQQDQQARELLDGVSAGSAPASNIFSTLVRHPGLFRRWLPFGGKLLGGGKLPARDRELLILRTGWLCRAEYEWAQHREISKSIGITDQEIARVREGPDAQGWEPFEATLMRAVDELHSDSTISTGTWAKLGQHYDEKQLIE